MEEMTKIIKNLFREKINIVIWLMVLLFVLNVCILKQNADNYADIRKKIDHRYFNTTKTIEEIYGVEIDTLNGRIIKRIK